jgi:hypothetical protein
MAPETAVIWGTEIKKSPTAITPQSGAPRRFSIKFCLAIISTNQHQYLRMGLLQL